MDEFEFNDEEDRIAREGRWGHGGTGRRFRAVVDFERGPFNYAEGMSYTADNAALDTLLDLWLDKGLVVLDRGGSQIKGGD